jgi:hypothetical protein
MACLIVVATVLFSFSTFIRLSSAYTYFPPGYNFMTQLTVNGAMINGTLTNFPVLIDITDANLTKAKSDGSDIVFMDSPNHKLNGEIELFDNSSGHLVAWVTLPTVSQGNDIQLSMYYSSSNVTTQNSSSVWDPNFVMVQHLEQSGASRNDSTAYANNGTAILGITKVAGKIDGADNFDGSTGFIQVANSPSLNPSSAMTIELWVNLAQTANYQNLINKGTYSQYYLRYTPSSQSIYWVVKLADGTVTPPLEGKVWNTAGWHYLVATVDTQAQTPVTNVYADGLKTLAGNFSAGKSLLSTTNAVVISDRSSSGRTVNGVLDEVRISNVARSAAWIQTSYNNQNNASAYITLGAEVQNSSPSPVILGLSPANGAIGVSLTPTLYVSVTQATGNMDVFFSENFNGTWVDLAPTYINVPDGTYNASAIGMTQLGTTYYWSVRVATTNLTNWTIQNSSLTTATIVQPPANLTGSASILVTTDGVTAYAVNVTSGFVLIQSANASSVLNTALASLPPGRTDIQEVHAIGNFTLDSALTIQSYTRFRLDGTLMLAPNLEYATHPDILHGPPNGGTNIELIGGTYDGNSQNGNKYDPIAQFWNYNALNCIYFNTTDNVLVRDVTAKNAGTVDIHFDSSQNYTLDHVSLINPGCHGMHNGHNNQNRPIANVTLLNVYVQGPPTQPFSRSDDGGAIVGGADAGYFRAINCIIDGAYAQGIDAYGNCNEVLIEGCQISHVGLHGIEAGGVKTIVTGNIIEDSGRLTLIPSLNINYTVAGIYLNPWISGYGVVAENIVTQNSASGIYINNTCSNVIISDNVLQSSKNRGDGVTVAPWGTNLTITNNKILGFQNSINLTAGAGNYTTIRNNELKPFTNFITINQTVVGVAVEWNDVNGTALLPTTNSVRFRYNTGYRTECSGSVTNSTATTFTFNHGLVGVPVFVSVSFDALGWTSWKWTATSTTITITITGVPESSTVTCYYDAKTWYGP